ncbi:uncharacterized protein LOC132552519 [Ylistrum balloti]|uniref:uncharacterized protein LOC132552519 n=1 Tax=Ylistrum balloti TaxID=509963 RepID=UPI0029058E24|nr:uncharacterized protein LOC132552519 [Ylistrum balloti]
MANMSCWKLSVLLISVSVNLFDLFCDWWFYREQLLVKDGLVFGPYEQDITKATLTFCIIASVTIVPEVSLDFVKYFKDSDKVELAVKIVAAITLLIEDLPQIAINIHVALCREEATNVVQLVKASAAITEVSMKLILIAIQLFRNKSKEDQKPKSKWRRGLKIFTFILLFIILALSITLLCITAASHKSSKSESLDKEKSDRYLEGVGMFMKLPPANIQTPDMAEDQWIMLTPIINITKLSVPADGLFLSVMLTSGPLQYIWVRKHFPGNPESLSCFSGNSTTSMLLPPKECSDIPFSTMNTTTVSIRFTYISPNIFQPMGDIHFNTELRQEFDQILTNETVVLKYFKVKAEVKGDLALVMRGYGEGYHFYSDRTDLLPIREVWKTGTNNCAHTGRESPKQDKNLFVRCVF